MYMIKCIIFYLFSVKYLLNLLIYIPYWILCLHKNAVMIPTEMKLIICIRVYMSLLISLFIYLN
jgi:hypothetical protein